MTMDTLNGSTAQYTMIPIDQCYKDTGSMTDNNDTLRITEESFDHLTYFRNEYFYQPFERRFNIKLKEYCDGKPIDLSLPTHTTLESTHYDTMNGGDDSDLVHSDRDSNTTLNGTTNTPTTSSTSTQKSKRAIPKKTSILENISSEKKQNTTNVSTTTTAISSEQHINTTQEKPTRKLPSLKPSAAKQSAPQQPPIIPTNPSIEIFKPNQIPTRSRSRLLNNDLNNNSQNNQNTGNNSNQNNNLVISSSPTIPEVQNTSPIIPPTPLISTTVSSSSSTTFKKLPGLRGPESVKPSLFNIEKKPLVANSTPSSQQQILTPTSLQQPPQQQPQQQQPIFIPKSQIYQHIDEEINNQMNQIYSKKIQFIKSNLPQYYKPHVSFDMSTVSVAPDDPILHNKGTLLRLGKCLMFDKIPLYTDIQTNKNYLDNSVNTGVKYWVKKGPPSLSEDPNIMPLVEKYDIDIVMSSSSLVKLVNNHAPFVEQWEIPTISKPYKSAKDGTIERKVTIISKPLLSKTLTNRERNEKFYNMALESLGLTLGEFNGNQPKDYSINSSNTTSTDINQNHNNNNNNNNTESSNSSKPDYLESSNLTYSIYEFGKLKVLIRCKIHALVSEPPGPGRYAGLKTKLEYQPERGLEDITVSDTSKWWIYTYIRPNATLLFARVNPWNKKLITLEKKEMKHIIHRFCQFDPKKSSKIVLELLARCHSQPIGSYLLIHNPKDSFVHIYKSNDSNNDNSENNNGMEDIYDLHQAHSTLPPVNMDIPTVTYTQIAKQQPIQPIQPIQPSIVIQTHPNQVIVNNNNTNQNNNHRSDIKICFSFAETGSCKNPKTCNFSHLTMTQIKEKGLEGQLTNRNNGKEKKKRKSSSQKKKKQPKKSKQNHNSNNSNNEYDVDNYSDDGDGEFQNNVTPASLPQNSGSDLSYINSFI